MADWLRQHRAGVAVLYHLHTKRNFVVRRADGSEVVLPYEAIQALMGTRLVLKPHVAEPPEPPDQARSS